jgi:hypothetical protein
MITVVNDHTKLNFSSFSIFFKGKNFINYQFHYLKFNFGHVKDPGSATKSSRILGVKSTVSRIRNTGFCYNSGSNLDITFGRLEYDACEQLTVA